MSAHGKQLYKVCKWLSNCASKATVERRGFQCRPANYSCNVDLLFRALGWSSLTQQRSGQKAIMMYKLLHNETPVYLIYL